MLPTNGVRESGVRNPFNWQSSSDFTSFGIIPANDLGFHVVHLYAIFVYMTRQARATYDAGATV